MLVMRRAMRWMWAATALPLALGAAAARAWVGADGPPPPAGPPVPAVARAWPVGVRPPVLRGWEPPATVYGPGHRGVDLGTVPGAPVRAVAAGRVSYAGRVTGRGVVAVAVTGTDLRTTYEPVTATVEKGQEVAAGEVVGTVEPGGAHCGARACVHWGLLRGDAYLDPLLLLPPWLRDRGPSRLLPVLGVPLPDG
ncbi:M23 family metallopeptidase [Streptomyces sp. NPDC001833]|uniref:M23 family metallopeptidase n=1 Tax=Streptomyces sp. NPDC001833 TaxID=3154658 RepID=UPI00332644DD